MMYINVKTMQYPISREEIVTGNPNTSFPENFRSFQDYRLVETTTPPSYNPVLQICTQGAPQEKPDGTWQQVWVVQDRYATEAEADAALAADQAAKEQMVAIEMREMRNRKLAECDWTQLDDTPLTNMDKAAWAAYRQQLRDITTQAGFPMSVAWPTKPE